MPTPGSSGSAGSERERELLQVQNPIVLVLVVVLVLDFGLRLVGEKGRANAQSLDLRKRRLGLFAARHPRLGHADLRSGRGNRDAKYASRLLRFGASPYQVFEDEDDDEDEYD